MVMMFPLSRYNEFCKEWKEGKWPHQRFGQAFHNYMRLDKITSEKERLYCDKLWEADNQKAVDLIDARIDDNC